MATLYGTNATKLQVTLPHDFLDPGEQNGRLRVAYDDYTASGVLTSGDVIRFMKLPIGARIINAFLSHDDFGTAGTLNLGWEASADSVESANSSGLLSSVDLNAAANVPFQWENAPSSGLLKKFSAEVQISATITQTSSTSGTIKCCMLYVVD
jgi:hypothetical protein